MKKQKIGLITLYKNNYGSSLQCYALKTVLENKGYDCELLYELQNDKNIVKKKFLRGLSILSNSIVYPEYFKSFLSMRKAMKIEQSYMMKESHKALEQFISNNLCPNGYTWEELKKIGIDSEYKAFVVGSDQVWNASRQVSPFFFLKFAPKSKRHTYAASFGVSNVPKWNRKGIKNGIEGFERVSVREDAGRNIVNEYTDKNVTQNIDPTMLLSDVEWRKFTEKVVLPDEQYILIHFLNEPSEIAIKKINILAKKTGYKVKGFAYSYDIYDKISDFSFIDGGPQEYVALIDNAQYVLTDSFHTTIFSINLHTNFYVFHRQYLHKFPQTSRIVELLDKFGFKDRLVISLNDNNVDCIYDKRVDDIIKKERTAGLSFINNEIIT